MGYKVCRANEAQSTKNFPHFSRAQNNAIATRSDLNSESISIPKMLRMQADGLVSLRDIDTKESQSVAHELLSMWMEVRLIIRKEIQLK